MKFSIGYNEKKGFFDLLIKNKEKICSVYFALPIKFGSSGRPSRQDTDYVNKINKLVILCDKLGIRTILLLNSTIDGKKMFSEDHLSKLFGYIEGLISIGLNAVSITNLLYVKILKNKFPGLIFYSSVNTRLKNVEQAIFFKKLGINILTIDRDINRDLLLIKNIKKISGLEIQLMLNEPCFRNCPFRSAHFEAVGNNNEQIFGQEFEDFTCYPMIKENNRLFFRIPFVRPEDLKYYNGLIDHYKLVSRDASNEKIEFMLNKYSNGYHNGNLLELFDLEPQQYLSSLYIDNNKLSNLNFFERIQKCPGNCDICTKCDVYF
ncbi:MAG: U32 family peptidase [Candidatus Gracilibacteria bacterium]